ncbi:unnamed protein product [Amoebophrya sp. A25]|nr:unnamed protein product [Amoebophrya sp. A25]|eukprot:GSA25T00014229001.1
MVNARGVPPTTVPAYRRRSPPARSAGAVLSQVHASGATGGKTSKVPLPLHTRHEVQQGPSSGTPIARARPQQGGSTSASTPIRGMETSSGSSPSIVPRYPPSNATSNNSQVMQHDLPHPTSGAAAEILGWRETQKTLEAEVARLKRMTQLKTRSLLGAQEVIEKNKAEAHERERALSTEVEALRAEKRQQGGRLQQLQSELVEARKSLASARDEAARARREDREGLESQLQAARTELEAAERSTAEKLRVSETRLRKKLEGELATKLESEGAKLSRMSAAENDGLRIELEQARKESDRLKRDLRKLRETTTAKVDTAEEIRRENLRLRTEITTAEKRLAQQETKAHSELSQVVAKHKAEVAALRCELASVQRRHEESPELSDKLEQQEEEHQMLVSELRSELLAAEERCTKQLQEHRKALRDQERRHIEEVDSISKVNIEEMDALRIRLEQREEEAAAMSEHVARSDDRYEKLRAESGSLRKTEKKLADVQKKLAEMEQREAEWKQQVADECAEFEKVVRETWRRKWDGFAADVVESANDYRRKCTKQAEHIAALEAALEDLRLRDKVVLSELEDRMRDDTRREELCRRLLDEDEQGLVAQQDAWVENEDHVPSARTEEVAIELGVGLRNQEQEDDFVGPTSGEQEQHIQGAEFNNQHVLEQGVYEQHAPREQQVAPMEAPEDQFFDAEDGGPGSEVRLFLAGASSQAQLSQDQYVRVAASCSKIGSTPVEFAARQSTGLISDNIDNSDARAVFERMMAEQKTGTILSGGASKATTTGSYQNAYYDGSSTSKEVMGSSTICEEGTRRSTAEDGAVGMSQHQIAKRQSPGPKRPTGPIVPGISKELLSPRIRQHLLHQTMDQSSISWKQMQSSGPQPTVKPMPRLGAKAISPGVAFPPPVLSTPINGIAPPIVTPARISTTTPSGAVVPVKAEGGPQTASSRVDAAVAVSNTATSALLQEVAQEARTSGSSAPGHAASPAAVSLTSPVGMPRTSTTSSVGGHGGLPGALRAPSRSSFGSAAGALTGPAAFTSSAASPSVAEDRSAHAVHSTTTSPTTMAVAGITTSIRKASDTLRGNSVMVSVNGKVVHSSPVGAARSPLQLPRSPLVAAAAATAPASGGAVVHISASEATSFKASSATIEPVSIRTMPSSSGVPQPATGGASAVALSGNMTAVSALQDDDYESVPDEDVPLTARLSPQMEGDASSLAKPPALKSSDVAVGGPFSKTIRTTVVNHSRDQQFFANYFANTVSASSSSSIAASRPAATTDTNTISASGEHGATLGVAKRSRESSNLYLMSPDCVVDVNGAAVSASGPSGTSLPSTGTAAGVTTTNLASGKPSAAPSVPALSSSSASSVAPGGVGGGPSGAALVGNGATSSGAVGSLSGSAASASSRLGNFISAGARRKNRISAPQLQTSGFDFKKSSSGSDLVAALNTTSSSSNIHARYQPSTSSSIHAYCSPLAQPRVVSTAKNVTATTSSVVVGVSSSANNTIFSNSVSSSSAISSATGSGLPPPLPVSASSAAASTATARHSTVSMNSMLKQDQLAHGTTRGTSSSTTTTPGAAIKRASATTSTTAVTAGGSNNRLLGTPKEHLHSAPSSPYDPTPNFNFTRFMDMEISTDPKKNSANKRLGFVDQHSGMSKGSLGVDDDSALNINLQQISTSFWNNTSIESGPAGSEAAPSVLDAIKEVNRTLRTDPPVGEAR